MKTVEEILKSKLDAKIAILNSPDYTFNKVIEAMEEYGKIMYNKAIDDAIKNAVVNLHTKGLYKGAKWILLKEGDSYNPLEKSVMGKFDKKSILKLKKK